MGDHAPAGRGLSEVAPAAERSVHPPRAFDADELEAGRLLFAREARFIAGAADPAALPPDRLPEVAFAGRSNVGKSSLVNVLAGRRMLARTSNTPGRTRQLNFFDLAGRLVLVDLPGYGYAAASKGEILRWTRLVRRYLESRAALRRTCLLLDARHGIKETDRPLLALLDACGASYQVVLTKADRLRADELDAIADQTLGELARHPAAHPELHLTSAREGSGIAALRATLASLAEPPSPLAGPGARR